MIDDDQADKPKKPRGKRALWLADPNEPTALQRLALAKRVPLITTGVDLHRVVDEASDALATDPAIYQRDGELVRIVRAVEPDEKAGVVPGTPQIRSVELPTLRETLTRVAVWQRVRKNRDQSTQDEACLPPDAAVSALLHRGAWPDTRPLIGVVESPCLKPDGTILTRPGYDDGTGLVYEPSCLVPRIKDEPTQAEAAAAYQQLADIFCDFPFVGEASSAVPIAAILTMIARPSFRGAIPMFVIDASAAGSGKSLLADIISVITTGRSAPKLTYAQNEEELEKTLSSAALYGARLLCLDNINSTLGAAPLDKVLTADDRVQMRILGRSEVRDVAWRATVLATGNNLILGADTPRRTLKCRLEPATERPEERTGFKRVHLLSYVHEFRGDFLCYAATILRAFVAAKRPNADSFTWGSYQRWSELVAGAIAFAGGPNVLKARVSAVDSFNPKSEALRTVLATLPSAAPDPITSSALITMLWPPGDGGRRSGPPDGYQTLRDALGTLCSIRSASDVPSAAKLSTAFTAVLGAIAGDRKMASVRPNKASSVQWYVVASDGKPINRSTIQESSMNSAPGSLTENAGNNLNPSQDDDYRNQPELF